MPTKHDKTLKHDPTAGMRDHRPDDRFVPVRACELIDAVAGDPAQFGARAADLREFGAALENVICQEAETFARRLGDRYAAFNPDRDTVPTDDLADQRRPEDYQSLEQRLHYLFRKANFRELDNIQIDAAVAAANARGLRVKLDPSRVRALSVWVRGEGIIERTERTWRKPRFGETRTIPVYRRVGIVAQLRDDPHVILKLFKEIPIEEVEALLPHAEATMNWLDQVKLATGGAGALGSTAMKLISGGAFALSRILWLLMAGFAMLAWRTFTGYQRVRTQRDLQRTTNLYYQNLANNAAALHTLVAMIAQEEMKEAFLAYALCTAAAEPPGSKAELDRRVEAYLCERFAARLDFDHTDALETLGRLGLWADPPALQVIAPAVAIERLRDHACARRSIGYHDDCASREETLASAKTGPPEGAPRAETGGDERYGSSLPEMTAASHNSSASA